MANNLLTPSDESTIETVSESLVMNAVRRPRGLMVCDEFRMAYRVLLCFEQAGFDVIILGSKKASGFRYSRICKEYICSENAFDGSSSPALVDELNKVIAERDIDIVFPGCPRAARSFAAIRDKVSSPCFPGPPLSTFDQLNNKWEFSKICKELEVLHPTTCLYDSASELLQDIESKAVSLPKILKPLALAGQKGVSKITRQNYRQVLSQLDYSPILVQEFIDGREIGAAMFCRDGEIIASISHSLDDGIYSTFQNSQVLQSITKIAKRFELNGVYNFDIMVDKDEKAFLLECNPRFYYKIFMSCVSGINFVRFGTGQVPADFRISENTQIRTAKALLREILKLKKLSARDKMMFYSMIKDPIASLRQAFIND